MPNIAIIGAGQLGGRHLQAVLKLDTPLHIWVVDPSPVSLDTARLRATEIPHGAGHRLSFETAIDALPLTIDYAIVATGADVRLAVLEALLDHARIKYLLLEKVLFQRLADYDRAAALLDQHDVTTWVDCTRRAYPIYHEVKAFFADSTIWDFAVSGGNWALGCNVVHFLDLFAFLSGELVVQIDTGRLDDAIVPGRRPGFAEFTGTLAGRSPSATFAATSRPDVAATLMITIRAEDRSCVLDEFSGAAFFGTHADKSWRRESFVIPFLSDVSTGIARDILRYGRCDLATFAESAACHRPLIGSLATFAASRTGGDPALCPIT